MHTFQANAVVEKNGKIQLEQLPFAEGETVHIVVSSAASAAKHSFSLKGSILKYEHPFEPVASEDWETGK